MSVTHEDARGRACGMHVIDDKCKIIQNAISDTLKQRSRLGNLHKNISMTLKL